MLNDVVDLCPKSKGSKHLGIRKADKTYIYRQRLAIVKTFNG
jgi:hypothetical protein